MTLYTLRSGASSHPENSVLQFYTDFVKSPGVLALSLDHFLVTEDTGLNMNVKIKIGRGYVKGTTSNTYPVRSDADATLAIGANASGNPRKDAVIVYIDLSASPNSDGSNVAKFLVVAGTPAASPNAPTDSEIQTAVGSSNPFFRVGNVYVGSGVGQIVNVNIEDTRVRATLRNARSTSKDNTDSSTVTFNFEDANIHNLTMGGNRTLAVSNMQKDDFILIVLKQDAAGGRVPTWFSGITWFGTDGTPNQIANKTTTFAFLKTGTNSYNGYLVGEEI